MKRTVALAIGFFVLIGGISFLLTSFSGGKPRLTKEEVIRMEVEERVQSLFYNKRERCRTEALEKAAAIVDSILITQAKANKDTIPKPPRPIKPEKPEILAPKDSTPVRPFLQKDSLKKRE